MCLSFEQFIFIYMFFPLKIAGSMMGTQPLPPHQQPGGGGPLGLKKQQEFLGNNSLF